MVSNTNYKGFTSINLNIFYEEQKSLRMLERHLLSGDERGGIGGGAGGGTGTGNEERELKLVNIINYKDQSLVLS